MTMAINTWRLLIQYKKDLKDEVILWEWQKYKRENPCFLYDYSICKEIKPKITIIRCVKYL